MNYTAYKNVKIKDGLLFQKQKLNRNVTINAVWKQFFDTGRIDAFKCEKKADDDIKKPHIYWDSDVAKWIEGASYIIAKTHDKELEEKIESVIDNLEKNMWEDGYYNSYYIVYEPENRFTNRDNHELYCAGHLIEAAVAYYEATGKDRFLKLMMRYADLIEKIFIKDDSAKFSTPGHEELELALLRLYTVTKNKKYLEMSKHFIEKRGNNEKDGHIPWFQDFPVREQKDATGHSVRLLYLYTAVAALAKETGDEELKERCREIFSDIYNHKMYITGGVGSTNIGEAFTAPYDLPNAGAYAETCAAISLVYFCRNMLDIEKKSEYADCLERALYNGVLSGLSLDGKAFFYENPLEINIAHAKRFIDAGRNEHNPIRERVEVFHCSCCPPNIVRFLEEYESFIYDIEDKDVYVNLFAESELKTDNISVITKTKYPENGTVKFTCSGAEKLYVRISSWCKNFKVNAKYSMKNGYACFENPTEIEIDFEMKPALIASNINVLNNIDKAALGFGPIVYCAEAVDNEKNIHSLFIDKNINAEVSYDDFFGANVITLDGYKKVQNSDSLYTEYSADYEKTKIKFIPFFGFANRGESDMLVFMKVK